MDAAELFRHLESMMERNVPLHKLTVRVEVSDSFYDKNISEDDVFERTVGDVRYLIIQGD